MEIQEIEKNYEKMSHDLNALRQDFSNAQRSLQRIETCLLSDKEINHVGLVDQVRDINTKVDEIDLIVKGIQLDAKLASARRGVWATIFGAVGAGLIWLLDKIF